MNTDSSNEQQMVKVQADELENLRLFAMVIDVIPDMIGILDTAYTVVCYNKAVYAMLGEQPETVIGKKCYANVGRQEICAVCAVKECYKSKKVEIVERYDPALRMWIELRAYPVFDSDGQLVNVIEHFRDITQRKLSEKALIEQKQLLQSITDNVFDLIALTDMQGHFLFLGKSHAILGYDLDWLIGRHVLEFVHPEDVERISGEFADFLEQRETIPRVEYRYRCADGQYIWLETVGRAIPSASGGEGRLLFSSRDVTARRRAEQDLAESEQRFKALHNASFGGITIHDKGVILECNQGLSQISGFSMDELIGMDGLLLIAEDWRPLVRSNIQAGYERPYEAVGVRKDGTRYPLRLEARNIPYRGRQVRVVEFRDITEQKQAEEHGRMLEAQLRQEQKLSAVGTLASGVAHEINNPLTGIINFAQLILDRLPGNVETIRDWASEILAEGDRIRTIVSNLLLFSRQESGQRQAVSPGSLVGAILSLCGNLLKKHEVEVEVHLDDDLPDLDCVQGQIQQVLLNLIINARDALDDHYPGFHAEKKVFITGHNLHDGEGRWVRFIVEDHGGGMSDAVAARCMEPFFTTKLGDRGTGLGLSVSYGIVREHGGRLGFETEEGWGTRFFLDLPVRCAAAMLDEA
ncbi:MAG TPA: PAS domain S-box protein [Spirochaetota bacterium]|nr:PAS domain S-box protein [Spirochaetota bacterium]